MVAALAICGVVAGNSAVMAAPVDSNDIPFNGTMSNMCAFGAPAGGTLGDIDDPTQYYIGSYYGSGAAPASINLTCNGDAQLAVSDFQTVSVPSGMSVDTNSGWWVVWASTSSEDYTSRFSDGSTSAPVSLTGIVNEDITVDMEVPFATAMKPGLYQFTTKLTATPQ